jgi:Tol biopolymer transport system component
MYSRKSNRPWRLLGTLGLLSLFTIIAFIFSPRVSSFSPTAESIGVPSSSPLVLEFSQDMDPISVETRLSLDPSLPGQFIWQDRVLTFQPQEPWPQGELITVRLQAGARSAQFLPILRSYSWAFTVGEPRVAYLWPASGPADIFTRSFETGSTLRITESPFGILDFVLSGDGTTIAYSLLREDGGSDLYAHTLADGQARLLVACPQGVRCQNPALSNDGTALAFERIEDSTRVWLKVGDADPFPITESEGDTLSPAWSSDGLLAYYDRELESVMVYDEEILQSIPNSLGMLGAWSPDGAQLLLPEIAFPDGGGDYISHLVLIEVPEGSIEDLSKESSGEVEDATPVYSPDGEQVAFARKYVDERWTPGRQLWVMGADGSHAQPLTNAPDFNHSGFVWSPNSDSILFTRFHLTQPSAPPEIWIVELASKQATQLVQGGILPQWIP